MKKIEVKVKYIFEGTYTVTADSIEEAKEKITNECGLVMGGGIHTLLDDDEIDWDFGIHPETQIVSTREYDDGKITPEEIECRNIYTIFKDNDGKKMIKILGYFYQNDEGWKHVEFVGFEMPVEEYVHNKDKWDEWESSAKQYITDMTERQVLETFSGYRAIRNERDISEFKDLDEATYC